MTFLHSFPSRVEGVLDVWDVDDTEIQFSEWKYCGKTLPTPKWRQAVCVCLENEQKLLLFNSFSDSLRFPSAPHITISRLSFTKHNHPVQPDARSLRNARIYPTHPDETRQTDNSARGETLPNVSPAPVKHSCSERSPKKANHALSWRQPNGMSKQYWMNNKRFLSHRNVPCDEDDNGLSEKRFPVFGSRRSRGSKHHSLHDSASSLVDISIQSDHLCPLGRSRSNETLSYCDAISKTGDVVGNLNFTEPSSDRPVSRPSFTRKLVRGIRRSLSLHHIEHEEPFIWKDDHIHQKDLNPQHLEDQSGPFQRCGSRASRLFLCVKPNGFMWKSNGHRTYEAENVRRKLLKAKTIDEETGNINHIPSFRYTASFPNSFAPESRISSSNMLVTSRSFVDSFGSRSTRLTHSQSTDSVQPDRCWPERSDEASTQPTGYALTVPGMTSIGAVHSSLTGGRSNCFLFVGPVLPLQMEATSAPVQANAIIEARIFAAPSELIRLRWIRSLRRTAKPNLENERHRENSLRLSILEARNLPSKRRYYCDICLDRTLYARTTSKTATAGIFWAEDFDLNNLPNVSVMTISLYKESDSGSKDLRRFATARMSAKKLRKSQNQLIGFVTVPMSDISDRNNVQTWLTLQPPTESTVRDTVLLNLASVGLVPSARNPMDDAARADDVGVSLHGSGSFTSLNTKQLGSTVTQADQRTLPQIRIRARYRSVDILPLRDYWALKAFLLEHSLLLSTWLDSVLPVKAKEEVASSLVGLHECNGTLVTFLTDLVVSEVAHLDNDSMAFRSNTMATKAVECFVKLVGSTYLHNLLYRLVQNVLTCLTAWEVNPEKLSTSSSTAQCGSLTVSDTATFAKSNELALPTRPVPGSLKANQLQLLQHLNLVWHSIQASLPRFPSALIRVFSSFRSAIEPSRGAEFCDNLISGCIFLRLICPALLSPSLFGLVSAFPSEPWCQRNLTLLAKSLQSLANFTAFDDKEPYMRFLNGYVSAQMPSMRAFIRNISNWATVLGRADDPDTMEGFRDVVDEGYELANLHLLLTEHLSQTEESTMAKSNQQLESVNEATNCGSTGTCLPEALSQLPGLLDDLTRRMDLPSTTGTTRSLPRYNNINNADSVSHRQLVDRLHATTLPTNHRKRVDGTDSLAHFLQSDTQRACTDSGSNMYAYHSASLQTKSVPYYTLHKNPGYHRLSDSGSNPGAVNIIAIDQSYRNPDGGDMAQPSGGPARANPNDYDEPYTSVQSDSDADENEMKREMNGDVMVSGVTHDRTEKEGEASSSNGSNVQLQITSNGSKSCIVATSEEPIYDIVPTSDDSSTDEIVETNETYLRETRTAKLSVASDPPNRCPSFGTLLNEDRCFKPVQLVDNTPSDSMSSFDDILSATVSEKSSRPGVERPNTIRLDQTAKTSLSPRLLPKQVTTASMVLTTPSSPTKPVESPTVNIQHVPTSVRPEFNGSLTNPRTQLAPSVDTSSYDLKSRNKPDLCQTSESAELVVNSVSNGNSLVSGIGKYIPVTRTYSDLDAYKEPSWTTHTSSSNSLTSIRGILHSPESLMTPCGATTSPEMLHSEVVHLRQQLQLSREDAARAANRLSQQEAELAQLRQSLEQMRTKLATVENVVAAPTQSAKRQTPANVSNPPRHETPVVPVNGAHSGRTNARPINDSKLAKTSMPMGNITTTTFEELNDVMAKLEHEQNELMREQARIRARLAASRPTTATATTTSPQLTHQYPNPKSTILSVRNSKHSTASTESSLSNHLVATHPTRLTGVTQPNASSSSVQYGPRIRHGPPPKPRSDNPPRYAY